MIGCPHKIWGCEAEVIPHRGRGAQNTKWKNGKSKTGNRIIWKNLTIKKRSAQPGLAKSTNSKILLDVIYI